MSKTALFTNFSPKEFVGWWNGKKRVYPPGDSEYMPDYLARHFAKHLANQELLRQDDAGNPIYKDGEKMTSPKKPEEVPLFMELFNKAYTPDETEDIGDKADDVDTLINVAKKNREARLEKSEAPVEKPAVQDPTQPQIITPPDLNDEDEDAFEGKPVE